METQNQIKRKLSQPEDIKFICKLLDASDNLKITKLANKLCEHFDYYNPLGEKQLTVCLVTLRELEQTDVIAIPQSPYKKKERSPRHLSEPLPEPQAVEVVGY